MYRIVFLDIDGTILSSDGKLDSGLIPTLEKLKRKGVLVGLATGRSLVGSKLYGQQLGCALFVTYQGSLVYDHDIMIYENRIPCHTAFELCSQTLEWGKTYVHFSGDTSRSNHSTHHIEHLLPKATLCDISETKQDAHRLSLYVEPEQRRKLESTLFSSAVSFDEEDRLEVFPSGSKWSGILPLIQKYGISEQEVVTIGNGMNDIEMLEAAGLGIAMDNAPKAVKQAANWVTKSNDYDGVSHALKAIFDL
jgi:Cof subfamily protein (haloacid dehalogenase superfamily)